jgi:hypothetical protein
MPVASIQRVSLLPMNQHWLRQRFPSDPAHRRYVDRVVTLMGEDRLRLSVRKRKKP